MCYCPKYIRGDDIKSHFDKKQVGDVDEWQRNLDGDKIYFQCLKEPNYFMKLMSSYGTLDWLDKKILRISSVMA